MTERAATNPARSQRRRGSWLLLRLARAGAKKMPYYHVVATDSRNPRDGKFIEAIGAYDPNLSPRRWSSTQERLEHWLKAGATPSETVAG